LFTTTSTNLGGSKYLWEYAQDTRVEAGTYTVKLMTEKKISIFSPKTVSIDDIWYKNNTGGSSDFGKGVYSFHGSVADVPTRFIGVAAGASFSLALEENDGTTAMYAWGTNDYGQLGLGNNNTPQKNMTQVPNFLPTNEKLRSVSAGAAHALALTESGKVYAWGLNSSGQLGLGHTTNINTPTPVSALNGKKIISIAAGDNHSLAMDDAFIVYSWGLNSSGQLGLGDTKERYTPTQVPDL
jgi:alpha-tubulin suppressor-like RCC1 family protein